MVIVHSNKTMSKTQLQD